MPKNTNDSKPYKPQEIEPKWQELWEKAEFAKAEDGGEKEKFYVLVEFPYPSGDGLHVGHVRSYSALDAVARMKRMLGYNVLFPMGFDAFGLPTENYAIRNKIPPRQATDTNIATFRRQMKRLGFSFDWSREVDTTDPAYYKWTQWIFLQLYRNGLAYRAEIPINWCPVCKTGLANEEVIDGKHERCGTPVTKKLLSQWLLKITEYADRLIDDLETVDYPERVKAQQINWIGRSTGAEVAFEVEGRAETITVFTTRPDTLFGATFMVLAPEHAFVPTITTPEHKTEVASYIEATKAKSDLERKENKEKTGVFTGAYALNPINGQRLPIWIADYVLTDYGTGAIMSVPAHDERDYEFAKQFNLPVKTVIQPEGKKTALVIPGADGDSTRNWYPWIKEELATMGYEVIVLDLSAPEATDLEVRLLLLNKYKDKLNENSVIIGHSVGALTAVQFLERNNLKIGKLVLVAPTLSDLDWEEFSKNFPELSAKGMQTANQVPVDWERIGALAAEIFVLYSDNDAFIPQVQLEKHLKEHMPYAKAVFVEGKFHFDDSAKVVELPELLDCVFAVFTGEGTLVNSGAFNGMSSSLAREKMTAQLAAENKGREKVQYKLRDWVFSRQRYWGEPIPILYCENCGEVPVPEDQLPVTLPDVTNYEPTETGASPLAAIESWVKTTCPNCAGPARRETDTMPNWAGSSWYFLRYTDPYNDTAFAARDKTDYWLPVDLYNGGMEHTTLHLLYSRFWHKFLYDQGFVRDPEPYARRRSHGIVLAADRRKMSKSFGNVVNPDDVVAEHGADTLRVYEMFMAPFSQETAWDPSAIGGVHRFLTRTHRLAQEVAVLGRGDLVLEGPDTERDIRNEELARWTHKTIKKVTLDLEHLRFNTAVSALMEFLNYQTANLKALGDQPAALREAVRVLTILLAPFAPHLAEEAWHILGGAESVFLEPWPKADEALIKEELVVIPIQIDGKVRGEVTVSAEAAEDEVREAVHAHPATRQWTAGKEVVKSVYVLGRLFSIATKQ